MKRPVCFSISNMNVDCIAIQITKSWHAQLSILQLFGYTCDAATDDELWGECAIMIKRLGNLVHSSLFFP